MKTKLLLCLFALVGVAVAQQVGPVSSPLAKMTVHVIDEKGEPVPDATVTIRFEEDRTNRRKSWSIGKTDKQGNYSAEGRHRDMYLGAVVDKEGYYHGGPPGVVFNDLVLGKLQPWNPVAEVVLRPMVKPVPLYAKRVETEIPVLDQPCGYDLEKGDWVAPYGKGTARDFIFTAHREFKSRNDFEVRVEMTFANPKDGILKTELPFLKGSVFRWERLAPEAGYEQRVQIRHAALGGKVTESFKDDDAYFFRLRTAEDGSGVIKANYAKISNGLRLSGMYSNPPKIRFFYYFNPTSLDRNLEWDMNKNLFTDLKRKEIPVAPY